MGLLAGGTYEKLRINGSRLRDGKNPDEPVIEVFLEETETGDTITDYLYTTDAAWGKVTMPRLKAYGWDPAQHNYSISDLNKTHDEGNPLSGKSAGPVVIKEEEYQGKVRSKVAQVGEYVRDQMDPAQASSFEARFRARVLALGAPHPAAASRKKAPQRPVSSSAPASRSAADDDVPF